MHRFECANPLLCCAHAQRLYNYLMVTDIERNAILALTTDAIMKVYSGRASAGGNHCRCGCRGTYRYNPAHATVGSSADRGWPLDASDINGSMVKKVFRILIAAALVNDPSLTMGDTYVDVEVYGRSYTAYFVKGAK